ncbi:MAG: HD domain-containing protein [Solobacterium sp.]|nr:HD domain-containing protein [Solobacterium sp.]
MTKIKDLVEKERLTQPMLIKSCSKGTTNKGAPYLNLELQDDTGKIVGKLWDAKESDEDVAISGTVVEASFEVIEYGGGLQLRVNEIKPLDQSTVDLREFLLTGKYTTEEVKTEIKKYVNSITNKNMKAIVVEMFKKVGDKYFEYPAASRIHHSFYGGLAEHSLGLVKTAEAIANLYPNLNYDLLISSALIHDMGKTVELGGLVSSEYSEEGRLTGHISICHGWLMEVAEKLGVADSEESLLLRHMILSHHGKLEYGSPVLPLLLEAEVLSMIDNIDARINTISDLLETLEEGKWSQRVPSLDGRQFYKPKL